MKSYPLKINKTKLVHPELSYKIVGILFEVYNELGPGYQEKYYQKAVAVALRKNKLNFKREVSTPLSLKKQKLETFS